MTKNTPTPAAAFDALRATDALFDRFNGANMRVLASRFNLTESEVYQLLKAGRQRNELAALVWHLCAESIYFSECLGGWFLTHREQWKSLSASLQAAVNTQRDQVRLPPITGWSNPNELSDQPADFPREPWQHPIIRQALIQISGGGIATIQTNPQNEQKEGQALSAN